MNDADRIRELEETLRERDAEIAALKTQIRELIEQLEAWKRGHRVRPGGKAAHYRRHKGRCTQCHKPVLAPMPEGLGPNPNVGVRAQAQVVEMRSDGQTLNQIQRQLERQGLSLSRGGIQQILHRSALVLEPARAQLRVRIIEGSHVWADETGYKVAGQSGYLWMIRGHRVVWFEADPSRGQQVAQRLLEGFTGTLHTDFYAVCWTLPAVLHQPCWGHLLRTTRQVAERTLDPGALELSSTLSWIYVAGVRAQARPDTAERHAIRLERALEDLAYDPTRE